MGKGNDPNCTSAVVMDAQAETPLTDKQKTAVAAARRLGLIRFRLTEGMRAEHRREASDGGTLLQRTVDDFGLLGQYERTVARVAMHHPDPRTRQEAQDLMVICNQRAVKSVARQWFANYGRYGFTLEELESAGNRGLMEATEDREAKEARIREEFAQTGREVREKDLVTFDPDLVTKANTNVKFSTFMIPRIHARIRRYIEHNSERVFGRRLTTTKFHEIQKVYHSIRQLEDEGLPVTAEGVLTNEQMSDFHPDKPEQERLALIKEAMDLARSRHISLNKSMAGQGGEPGDELGAFIEDHAPTTDRQAIDNVANEEIKDLLTEAAQQTLSEQERKMFLAIDMAQEIDSETGMPITNQQAAAMYGVNPSRVSQLRQSAQRKIRKHLEGQGITSLADIT